jgi:hypothetical protein
MADIKEQILIEANYILRFIVEIEDLIHLICQYKVFIFGLDKMVRNACNVKEGLFSKEGMEKLGQDDRKAMGNLISNIRVLASSVKVRYDTLRLEKGFDDITPEFNDLFKWEVILPADLDNFLEKLNKAYYKL